MHDTIYGNLVFTNDVVKITYAVYYQLFLGGCCRPQAWFSRNLNPYYCRNLHDSAPAVVKAIAVVEVLGSAEAVEGVAGAWAEELEGTRESLASSEQ